MEEGFTRRALLGRAAVAGAGLALGGAAAPLAAAEGVEVSAPVVLRQPGGGSSSPQGQTFVNEALFSLSPTDQLVPWLAESYKQVSLSRYVVKLRAGVRFADGSLLTPGDVVYSILRNRSPAMVYQGGGNFLEIKSIRHTGPQELTIDLNAPDLGFPYEVFPTTLIHKQSFSEPLGVDYGTSVHKYLGTGPYIVTSQSTTGMSARRNPHYWGKHWPLDRLEFINLGDANSTFLALQNGNIDGVLNIAPLEAPRYARLPGVTVTGALAAEAFLSFDMTVPPFTDIHVRRAIAHCWDSHGFISGTMRGLVVPSNGPALPWQWNSVLTPAERRAYFKTLPTYPFSIAQAKAELAKSSVPNGFSTETAIPASVPSLLLALETLAHNLAQIGINLQIHETDVGYYDAVMGHKYPIFLNYWAVDYPDPQDAISLTSGTNIWNVARYNDPTVLKLEAAEQASTNKAFRKNVLKEIYTKYARDLPYYGLWWEDLFYALRAPFSYTPSNVPFQYPWWQHVHVGRG
jgi:peptide/nickel transport system substrate-binding protein